MVVEALTQQHPETQCEVVVIRTAGDETADRDDNQFEGQGVFVRRLEEALLNGSIDLAVHSFKDLPSRSTPGLTLAALPPREDARDVLVARAGRTLATLRAGARVGTGSPRRRALLLDLRPDIEVIPIRGNVDTRLRRATNDLDGVVLAAAGLRRLGRDAEATDALDPAAFIPAVGQGILAVQTRADDARVIALVQDLDDPTTRACALAERAVALAVDATCNLAFGAYAQLSGDELTLDAFIAPGAGEPLIRVSDFGKSAGPEQIGARVGARLRARS
jgi:hydroxymethylbilane synthase